MSIIGIDVGGTFTDVVLFDREDGSTTAIKVPSTPDNPASAVIDGLDAVGRRDVDYVVHGTTVATNALLERRGALVALLTTEGFRDVLEVGTTQRLVEGGLFNAKFARPAPFIPRLLRFEVKERVTSTGDVLVPLDERQVELTWQKMAETGVEAVAICFLHSYRNPVHEDRAAEILRDIAPSIFVTRSSRVVGEYREFRRFATTAINGYVGPTMARYLQALTGDLAKAKRGSATLLCMGSNGGIVSPESAATFPVRTILSGPVGGVTGAVDLARRVGLKDVITYDMGGTSTDVALIDSLRAVMSQESIISGVPVGVPQVQIVSAGAGGGSVAWVEGKRLGVGPRSVGAHPGPASYQKGGSEPTVTDANLVLGRLADAQVLGAALTLNRRLAENAIATLAPRLGGIDPAAIADGIVKLAVAKTASSIREVSVMRGFDPRDFAIIAFGGAGPMHAAETAEELGCRRVLVPQYPGNFSALGGLLADLRYDYASVYLRNLDDVTASELRADYQRLEKAGFTQLDRDGVRTIRRQAVWSAALRYHGQGFELSLTLEYGKCTPEYIRARFSEAYERTYEKALTAAAVDLVVIRVSVVGEVPHPVVEAHSGQRSAIPLTSRDVFFGGKFVDTPVYDRADLLTGESLSGPAVISESGATTIVPPDWCATADSIGNLHLEYQLDEE